MEKQSLHTSATRSISPRKAAGRLFRRPIRIAKACGAGALLALVAACGQGPAPDDLIEGRYFPALVLHGFDGEPAASVADYRGRLVVLNVWATWCPPCRRELPSLERLQARLGEEDFAVLGLSVDNDADIAQEYLIERGITFRNFLDLEGRDARRLLGIRIYPDTFIISPEGVLLRSIVGERSWDDPAVAEVLRAAHAGDTAALARL